MQNGLRADYGALALQMQSRMQSAMLHLPTSANLNNMLSHDALDSGFVRITLADIETMAVAASKGEKSSPIYGKFLAHSSANRVSTDTLLTTIIREANPGVAVVASRDYGLNIFGFPGAEITPLSKDELNAHLSFRVPARRGESGGLILDITFGAFTVKWGSHTFLMYTAQMDENFSKVQQYWFVHDDESVIHQLLLASSSYAYDLHEEILVFAHGFWNKSHDLWLDVQKANWDDVILDAAFKKRVQDDIAGFFASEKIYKDLAIPWKRGIIFLGPPGNGKTVSLKAVMKSSPHPVLYVKNFTSFMGDEMSMQIVFQQARRAAPCLLILEDLDSLITNLNRSFFLNELDGMAGNDGILLIGTTNYFDKLDPSLSKRPSRFDRKFEFLAPTKEERRLYMKYWQTKLGGSQSINLSDKLADEIVELTDGFSFAYLKEAMVSSLVVVAGNHEADFEEVVKQQIQTLRKSIEAGGGKD